MTSIKLNQRLKTTAFIALVSSLIFFVSSCKTKSTSSTGTIYIHMHTDIDTNEVADDTTLYDDGTGRHFSLSTGQFYITDISLHSVTGTTYKFSGVYVLKTIGTEQYLVGQAPVGTYDNVSFTIGVSAADNSIAPSSFASTHALNNTDMWFGNTIQGYMFVKVEGKADTTAAQTGANLMPFVYEIGGATNLRTVTMPTRTGSMVPYILTSGGTQYVHMTCDFSKLLSGVNFKTDNNLTSPTANPTLATTIANNIGSMFEYEE